MKDDNFFKYMMPLIGIVAIVAIVFGMIFMMKIHKQLKWHTPDNVSVKCGSWEDDVATCVGAGKIYTCVLTWKDDEVNCALREWHEAK